MEYTLVLQSPEDYHLIEKILKAFDGASITPVRKRNHNVNHTKIDKNGVKVVSSKVDKRLKAFDKLAGSLSLDMVDMEDPRTKYLLSK